MNESGDEKRKSWAVRAVTNEGSLFAYRLVTGLCSILCVAFLADQRSSLTAVRDQVNGFILTEQKDISALEVKATSAERDLLSQAARITGVERAVQIIDHKLYEVVQRLK